MAIHFIKVHESLIKVTHAISESSCFFYETVEEMGSCFLFDQLFFVYELVLKKRLTYIFILRRFKYVVIVHVCSTGEL